MFKEIHVNGDPLIGSDPDNAAPGGARFKLAFMQRSSAFPNADFEKAYHSFDGRDRHAKGG